MSDYEDVVDQKIDRLVISPICSHTTPCVHFAEVKYANGTTSKKYFKSHVIVQMINKCTGAIEGASVHHFHM